MSEKLAKAAHVWARDPLDWYVEQEWVSASLFAQEVFQGDVLDPACGLGRIPVSAAEAGLNAVGTDVAERWGDRYPGVRQGLVPTLIRADFLDPAFGSMDGHLSWWRRPTNIVCNPPFRHTEQFVRLSLERATQKVALLLPTVWANSVKTRDLLQSTPFYREYRIGPRPSMPPGAAIIAGQKPGNGTKDFSWFIWLHGFGGDPTIHWLRRQAP